MPGDNVTGDFGGAPLPPIAERWLRDCGVCDAEANRAVRRVLFRFLRPALALARVPVRDTCPFAHALGHRTADATAATQDRSPTGRTNVGAAAAADAAAAAAAAVLRRPDADVDCFGPQDDATRAVKNLLRCSVCGKYFRSHGYMDQHFRRRHPDLLPERHVCLDEFCDAFDCRASDDALAAPLPPPARLSTTGGDGDGSDGAACDATVQAQRRAACSQLLDDCIGGGRGKGAPGPGAPATTPTSAQDLRAILEAEFCAVHTCGDGGDWGDGDGGDGGAGPGDEAAPASSSLGEALVTHRHRRGDVLALFALEVYRDGSSSSSSSSDFNGLAGPVMLPPMPPDGATLQFGVELLEAVARAAAPDAGAAEDIAPAAVVAAARYVWRNASLGTMAMLYVGGQGEHAT